MVSNTNSFAKTICSICFEDLKPIVEDLQTISICGHVFHELCLQQWFEYCTGAKKRNCPVCKQSCSGSDVIRLYFQSVGDQNESFLSQKAINNCEEDPELLRGEVKRLEGKVSGLISIVERQGKEIKMLNEQLYLSTDQLKKEVTLKYDAMEQKASIQQLLISKSHELDALKLEHIKLQDRNMALAKELAALKLVSDLNLEEDEVLKLASFGNEANNKDTIDILRKSLVLRNKSYKELMTKCNQLGRGEARSCKKLEKAKEKINKLKTRVQELEAIVEVKDNEALRTLKASKHINHKEVILNGVNYNCNALSNEKEQDSVSVKHLVQTRSLTSNQENFNFINYLSASSTKECTSTVALNKGRQAYFAIDKTALERSTAILLDPASEHPSSQDVKSIIAKSEAASDMTEEANVHRLTDKGGLSTAILSNPDSRQPTGDDMKSTIAKPEAASDINEEAKGYGLVNKGGLFDVNNDKGNILDADRDEEVTFFCEDITQVQSILNIKKESASPVSLCKPGDICFSGGLLGLDGSNRYLGKWCKRVQSKGSVAVQGSSTGSGDLISVGSDGRGGRIKVLRSLNQSSLDGKENSVLVKRHKYGAKASSMQSQGCLQIEHFFGRATQ